MHRRNIESECGSCYYIGVILKVKVPIITTGIIAKVNAEAVTTQAIPKAKVVIITTGIIAKVKRQSRLWAVSLRA